MIFYLVPQVLGEMTPHELGMLLKFVTSCSRAPLGGFKYLHPPLTIHKVGSTALSTLHHLCLQQEVAHEIMLGEGIVILGLE